MKSLSKANTILKQELTKKITDVLQSFAYDEIAGEPAPILEDCLLPVRYYTKDTFSVTAVLKGECNLQADAELLAVAINALLAAEADQFDVKLSHGKLQADVKGEISALDSMEQDSDALDDLYALADLAEGYGLPQFLSVDLTKKADCDGIFFGGYVKDACLCRGARNGDTVILTFDLWALAHFKLGNKELKDPVSVVLVASDLPENAYRVAFGLRRQGLKTEGYVSGGSMYEAEEYCDLKGIPTLIWVAEHKVFLKNVQTGETAETTLEKLLQK